MSDPRCLQPLISRLYVRFLREGNSADFIRSVARSYTVAGLHRALRDGDCPARRSAALALTYLGGGESIAAVGRALRDPDRAVRFIVENGIGAVWSRAGSMDQQHRLQRMARWNRCGQFAQAIDLGCAILEENPGFGEVWYQRAFAQFSVGDFEASVADSQQALETNPYQFHAAVGLGQSYLELEDVSNAIRSFRWALRIHPHLEFARAQIRRLEREQRERLDR